jgi:hypothetical protein
MNNVEQTVAELKKRVDKVDDLIAKKGVGSNYLKRAKKIQRRLNLSLVGIGAFAATALIFWTMNQMKD